MNIQKKILSLSLACKSTLKMLLVFALVLLLIINFVGCAHLLPGLEPVPASGKLIVHFIDVGQGDAILIQTPEQNILIDGGNRGDTVLKYLHSCQVASLDLVIATHPHADHIGGLISVLENMPVDEVLDPAVVHTTKTFEDYLTVIDQKNIPFTEGRAGMEKDLGGGGVLKLLHPVQPSSNHLNDASLVARVTFGHVSFLFAGDIEERSEKELLERKASLQSTVLKVAHHGSASSSTETFLKAVDPEIAVIMVGTDNSFGHPHREVLERLDALEIEVYRTDLHGTIILSTDGSDLYLE